MARTAAVVGAGVAGLASAVFLRRHGWDVVVYDERPRAEVTTGSGLVLWPNAQRTLRTLGIDLPGDGLGLSLLDARGIRLAEASATELAARLGGCPRVVLRAALMVELEAAATSAGAALAYDRRLTGLTRGSDGWLLSVGEERTTAPVDVVLGCDGIRSAVRRLLSPGRTARPRFRSRTAYRGVSTAPAGRACMTEAWGAEGRFGYAPLPDGSTYWFADLPADRAGERVDLPELRSRFSSWSDPIPQVLDGADASCLSAVDVQDLPLLPRWRHRGAALLGDAAHAMTPDLGQGAGQALEDAAALEQHLVEHPAAPDLRQVMRRRRTRSGLAVLASRAAGAAAQPLPSAAAHARAAALRALPDRLVLLPATAFARTR